MACLKLLKTDFITAGDAGGVWTYIGPSSISVTITGSGTVTLQPGDVIDPGNDDPELDFDTLTGLACSQTYTLFRYTVELSGCVDTADVQVTIACPPEAGTDAAISLCETDAAFNIFNQLGGSPDTDGAWTGTGTASPGYSNNATPSDPTDDTFDPATAGAGVYVFTYTVTDSSTDCPCPDATADLTVTITAAPDAGTGSTAQVCI